MLGPDQSLGNPSLVWIQFTIFIIFIILLSYIITFILYFFNFLRKMSKLLLHRILFHFSKKKDKLIFNFLLLSWNVKCLHKCIEKVLKNTMDDPT